MKLIARKSLLIVAVVMLTGCFGRFKPYENPKITVTPEGVQVPACEVYNTSSERAMLFGCYVESGRWQMMVHPEKAAHPEQLLKVKE
ncbi:hypothetical protein M3P05_00985 [Sansalvadorimonas sp. 2012CJ34-2]|uniref:Uncharacterized protein n=1 Tax=Parendozoicomonas callyspongiae TaxID=2942213 RepID=A0ABT0PBW1_9GAMM|nr:hypothetical protein [Sansalvadorimonas sp. 2012CJ34-2]MCL6268526.1 hypothetical protein [Sansalvadorimonas sp. 2012CJ34-2]